MADSNNNNNSSSKRSDAKDSKRSHPSSTRSRSYSLLDRLSRRSSSSELTLSASKSGSLESLDATPPKYLLSYSGYQLMGCLGNPITLASQKQIDDSHKIGIVIATDKKRALDFTTKNMLDGCQWSNAKEVLDTLPSVALSSVSAVDANKSSFVQKILHVQTPDLTEKGCTLESLRLTYQNILLMAASYSVEILILPRLSMGPLGADWTKSTQALKEALNLVSLKSSKEPIIILWLGNTDGDFATTCVEYDQEMFVSSAK